tara:strand:+ start:105 stop:803 length:699 start_codon:yes stop_codon:yes gene_type:complete
MCYFQEYILSVVNQQSKKHELIEELIKLEVEKVKEKLTKHPIWFIDIPRTSSFSISVMMADSLGFPFGKKLEQRLELSPILYNHTHAFAVKYLLGKNFWDTLTTFTIVRNPYTWAASLWHKGVLDGHPDCKFLNFMQFLDVMEVNLSVNILERQNSLNNFTQTDYFMTENNSTDVLKFEDRQGIKQYLNKLGLEYTNLLHLNKSNNVNYQLSQLEKKKVEDIFAKDFELLGY